MSEFNYTPEMLSVLRDEATRARDAGFPGGATTLHLLDRLAELEAELAATRPWKASMDMQGKIIRELEKHISELEKSLENARKERDETRSEIRLALIARDQAAAIALKAQDEIARLKPSVPTTSAGSIAAGYVRLDDTATLFGARSEAPTDHAEMARREGFNEGAEAMAARLKPSGQVHTLPVTPAMHAALDGVLGAKPSGQVAEDEQLLRNMLDQFAPLSHAALARLAAKARGYEAISKKRDNEQTLQAAQRDSALRDVARLRAERDAAVAALEAGKKLMAEHMRQRDAFRQDRDTATSLNVQLRREHDAAVADNAAKDSAFAAYVEMYGVQHGDVPGTETACPEDDTCECAHIQALNAAFGPGRHGAALLERIGRFERVLRRIHGLAEQMRPDVQAGLVQTLCAGALDGLPDSADPLLERLAKAEADCADLQDRYGHPDDARAGHALLERVKRLEDALEKIALANVDNPYKHARETLEDISPGVKYAPLVLTMPTYTARITGISAPPCTDGSCAKCRSGEPCH